MAQEENWFENIWGNILGRHSIKFNTGQIPKGVVPITWKDGSTTYSFQGKEYSNVKDIPVPRAEWINTTASVLGESISKIPNIDKIGSALAPIGSFADQLEHPYESQWAEMVGDSFQHYGIDRRIGVGIGYATFPGLGEVKAGRMAIKGSMEFAPALARVDGFAPNVKPLQITSGTGVVRRTKKTNKIKELIKHLPPGLRKRDITKRYADDPEFLKKLELMYNDVRKYVDDPELGYGRLDAYSGQRTITAPDGREYRFRDSNKAGRREGLFSINQDISARNTQQIRKIAQQPDTKSIESAFRQKVNGKPLLPANKVKSAVESYNRTNKTIYNQLTAARARYNNKLKALGRPKSEHATIEHIFDVDFYKRLGDEVKTFSGRGADEAWNLKMISFALNSKTGALNKKVGDIGDTLISAVKMNEFIDYNKVVRDYVDLGLGSKINRLTPKDWDKITEFSMKNTNLNMQQILVEYTKNL